jgi:pseudaminic acid synthase
LKCTSSYPAPYDEVNLSMIKKFSDRFGVTSGLSDHTIGSTVPLLSLAFGARVIEKHFIIDRSIGGPDSSFSMDKDEFSNMIKEIRKAEKCIGSENFLLTDSQIKGRDFSRSLYVVDSVKNGQIVSEKNVRSIRPGFGLHPKHLPEVLGKKFNSDVEKGTRFSLDLID